MTTGERIRSLREKHGFTQAQLAEMTGYTDRSSITKIESGKAELSESKIAAFAKALHTTPAVILGLSDIPEESDLEKKYNRLDPHGKKVVDFVLDEEYKRCVGKDETSSTRITRTLFFCTKGTIRLQVTEQLSGGRSHDLPKLS